MTFKLSAVSERRLSTVAEPLRSIVYAVAADFPTMVVCGHRTQADQEEAFRLKRSKLSWPRSKHNSNPSRAVDLAPLKNGAIDWNDREAFRELARRMFFHAKARGVDIRWGGDFNMDGLENDRFIDMPHFELLGSV
jgi:peptidoglycan L-alanyl-D-glutamate endopeptidase CwlK